MKVLFIGGTGNISTASVQLAAEKGIDLYVFNRGKSGDPLPEGVTQLKGDWSKKDEFAKIVEPHRFDVVVNWIIFVPEQIEADYGVFKGKVGQYIFISSASCYQKPAVNYIITESTPLHNPFWEYSRNKIACELKLMELYRNEGFPATIVRPSFTFGDRWIPAAVGSVNKYTVIDRMKKGKKVIVHGDGQSLWSTTHNTDFAKGLVGLLGNTRAIGEAFHISTDEVLTWDQMYMAMGRAVGVEPKLVHIPSEFINEFAPDIGANLLGDKACSMVMDNSKLKRVVPEFKATMPFSEGIKRSVAWFEADRSRQVVDEKENELMDRIIDAYEGALKKAAVK